MKAKKAFFAFAIAVLFTSVANAQSKPSSHPSTKQQDTLYTCTMHPEVVSNKPGKCPKCGMDLVVKKNATKADPAMHKKPVHKMDSTKSTQKMPA
jgi:hypothetical protein